MVWAVLKGVVVTVATTGAFTARDMTGRFIPGVTLAKASRTARRVQWLAVAARWMELWRLEWGGAKAKLGVRSP
jgi:hypothetical protein